MDSLYVSGVGGQHFDADLARGKFVEQERVQVDGVRYVTCLRYAMRETDGRYREPRDRAVVYVDARLDRVMENPGEACNGATYAAFPELEKITR